MGTALLFILLIAVVPILCRVVGTAVPSLIEKFSTHALIVSAIFLFIAVNSSIFFIACIFIYSNLSTATLDSTKLVPLVILLLLPLRVCGKILTANTRIRKELSLQPVQDSSLLQQVKNLCAGCGLKRITIYSSGNIDAPLVFGITSKSTNLVIPEKWTFPIEEKQTIIIYHEIAHVLNKDMGFMTWAWVLFDKSSTASEKIY